MSNSLSFSGPGHEVEFLRKLGKAYKTELNGMRIGVGASAVQGIHDAGELKRIMLSFGSGGGVGGGVSGNTINTSGNSKSINYPKKSGRDIYPNDLTGNETPIILYDNNTYEGRELIKLVFTDEKINIDAWIGEGEKPLEKVLISEETLSEIERLNDSLEFVADEAFSKAVDLIIDRLIDTVKSKSFKVLLKWATGFFGLATDVLTNPGFVSFKQGISNSLYIPIYSQSQKVGHLTLLSLSDGTSTFIVEEEDGDVFMTTDFEQAQGFVESLESHGEIVDDAQTELNNIISDTETDSQASQEVEDPKDNDAGNLDEQGQVRTNWD